MDCPTSSVGSVGLSIAFLDPSAQGPVETVHIDALIERLEREEFDLIAVGRALISEPLWAYNVRAGDFAALKAFDTAALPAPVSEFAWTSTKSLRAPRSGKRYRPLAPGSTGPIPR